MAGSISMTIDEAIDILNTYASEGKERKNWEAADDALTLCHLRLDGLVRPGDRLIISIRFLDSDEFGDEEITHQDLVLEDFLQFAESPDWDAKIVKIERSNDTGQPRRSET